MKTKKKKKFLNERNTDALFFDINLMSLAFLAYCWDYGFTINSLNSLTGKELIKPILLIILATLSISNLIWFFYCVVASFIFESQQKKLEEPMYETLSEYIEAHGEEDDCYDHEVIRKEISKIFYKKKISKKAVYFQIGSDEEKTLIYLNYKIAPPPAIEGKSTIICVKNLLNEERSKS